MPLLAPTLPSMGVHDGRPAPTNAFPISRLLTGAAEPKSRSMMALPTSSRAIGARGRRGSRAPLAPSPRFWIAVVLAGLLAICSQPCWAGPPFVTDDPVPTPLGQWEVYAFSAAASVHGDTAGTLIGTEINYGAAPNLMLHMIVPLAFDQPDRRGMRTGIGDIELGAKYRLFDPGKGDWKPQVGIFPLIEIPSGDADRGLGGGYTSAYFPIWIEKDLGRWTTYGGGGYWINPGRGNKNYWFVGDLVQRQVTDQLALGAEVFHQSTDTQGGPDSSGFNVGGVFDFNDHYHLLFSAGRGLRHANPTNQFSYYLGLQWTG